MTLTRREVLDLLDRFDLSPSRALGQNFVVDPNTVRRVARLAEIEPGDRVVEIGAGVGCLTLALVEAGAEVTAIEVDRHLVPALRSVVEPLGVRVVKADAMSLDWSEVIGPDDPAGGARAWSLVANLPYNVATPLVLELLDRVPAVERMLVMVQREVGERLAAVPGSGSYGIPSVKVAYWATSELVGTVPPTVFWPQPRVDSVLVRIARRESPAVDADPVALFGLVRLAFGQRRKMLRRSLAGMVTSEQFDIAEIDPKSRPEELSVSDWGRLAAACHPRAG